MTFQRIRQGGQGIYTQKIYGGTYKGRRRERFLQKSLATLSADTSTKPGVKGSPHEVSCRNFWRVGSRRTPPAIATCRTPCSQDLQSPLERTPAGLEEGHPPLSGCDTDKSGTRFVRLPDIPHRFSHLRGEICMTVDEARTALTQQLAETLAGTVTGLDERVQQLVGAIDALIVAHIRALPQQQALKEPRCT